jgi:hypothetical protein
MEVTTRNHYRLVSRIGGAAGLVLLVLLVPASGGPFFTNASNAEIVGWVRGNPTALYVEGLRTWLTVLMVAGFIVTLLWRTRGRGLVVTVVCGLLAANLAIDMLWGGVYYALAKVGQMHAPDAGVLALFALAQELTFTDGVWFGLALLVVSVLALRARTLPRPIAWLGVVCALVHVLGVPVQLLLTGTVEGVTGPVSVVAFLVWLLATALSLLIRPGQVPAASPIVVPGPEQPAVATA